MKKLSLLFFLIISLSAFGQENIEPRLFPKTEFGFNATSFVQNLIPFSDQSAEESGFSTFYFKTGNGVMYFRSGLLLDFESEKDDIEKTTNNLLGVRFGFEKKNWISKSWAYHYGGDILGKITSSKIESNDPIFGIFDFKETGEEIGLAALFGIQWFLNDNLALSTESYFSGSILTTKVNSAGSNVDDAVTSKLKLVTPTSIYFSIYF